MLCRYPVDASMGLDHSHRVGVDAQKGKTEPIGPRALASRRRKEGERQAVRCVNSYHPATSCFFSSALVCHAVRTSPEGFWTLHLLSVSPSSLSVTCIICVSQRLCFTLPHSPVSLRWASVALISRDHLKETHTLTRDVANTPTY